MKMTPLLCLLALLAVAPSTHAWKRARATWYDDNPWMSVHDGSCMYGYLGDRFGGEQNWHVGAINDGMSDYAGSCGRCYEMKCEPGVFSDNLGNKLDRTKDCLSQEPITIAITDTCPCYKPENAYSNKRWCCGDMDHFDIGIWAFKKMANPGKGVVMVSYRQVECPSGLDQPLSSRQNPSSLRTQYPWSHGDGKGKGGDKGGKKDETKVTSFSGPPDSDKSSSPSPSPSPNSWSPSPSPSSPSPSPNSWSPSPSSPSPSKWSPSPSSSPSSPSPSPSPSKWSPSPSSPSPSPSPSPKSWSPSPSPSPSWKSPSSPSPSSPDQKVTAFNGPPDSKSG